MHRVVYFLLLVFMAASVLPACQPVPGSVSALSSPTNTPGPDPTETPEPTQTTEKPEPITLVIDLAQTHQTIREVAGGNFIHRFNHVTTPFESISEFNLETLQPRFVRVIMDIDLWEPNEGAAGEEVGKGSGFRFRDESYLSAVFQFMQQVKQQIPDVTFVASIWQVADWMAGNPSTYKNRRIPPERYADLADSIAHWLLYAREKYGVEVPYVSFNEANGGINILLKPEEYVAFIKVAGARFTELGLNTRWLIGDASNITEAFDYARSIYEAKDIRPYLGPLTFHSWDPDSAATPGILKQIGQYADQNGLEVWCTEGGWDPYEPSYKFRTFEHAIKLASIYTRVLRDSRTTALLYWEMMYGDYTINTGKRPYPAMTYLVELQKHFPVGAQIVQTPSDPIQDIGILSLAAQRPDGAFSVELINRLPSDRQVTLTGLPDGVYHLTRLSDQGGREEIPPLEVKAGHANLVLPGETIYFFEKQP